MSEEKKFPLFRTFCVLVVSTRYHRAISLSAGTVMAADDPEHILQKYLSKQEITVKLVHETGRYEHLEEDFKGSFMYWELDRLVENKFWKELSHQ